MLCGTGASLVLRNLSHVSKAELHVYCADSYAHLEPAHPRKHDIRLSVLSLHYLEQWDLTCIVSIQGTPPHLQSGEAGWQAGADSYDVDRLSASVCCAFAIPAVANMLVSRRARFFQAYFFQKQKNSEHAQQS